MKLKQETDVRSSILWFPYRYPLETKIIYNLFSNFGNISCITIKKDNAYVKFRTKEFAAIANTYLNNMVLADNIMVLRECPEASDCWKPIEGESSQCTYYDSSYDRYCLSYSDSLLNARSLSTLLHRRFTFRRSKDKSVNKMHSGIFSSSSGQWSGCIFCSNQTRRTWRWWNSGPCSKVSMRLRICITKVSQAGRCKSHSRKARFEWSLYASYLTYWSITNIN